MEDEIEDLESVDSTSSNEVWAQPIMPAGQAAGFNDHGQADSYLNVTQTGMDADNNEDNQEVFPAIVPLNVGGVKYMTRISTLCKYPESMLAVMFSGRHSIDKDLDGNYFLDSNGSLFRYILDFLRFGQLPPNSQVVDVYREANYYGLQSFVDRLSLNPEIARCKVKDLHRAQFPNYYDIKENVIKIAIEHATVNKAGEVLIYAFRTEFIPKSPAFNPNHGCIIEQADITVGPWESSADEETFMRCLESDLMEDGFEIKPHETKKKCKYYFGQTCQRFIYRLSFVFD